MSGTEQKTEGGRYRWQWRDGVIAVLALALLAVGIASFAGRQGPAAKAKAGAPGVAVFDVVLDRDSRQWVDVYFDRPVLGDDVRVGDVLARPPATVVPQLDGSWRWRDRSILRFEPSGGFPPATTFRFELIPDRFLGEGKAFAGDEGFDVRVDQFVVESVEVEEESAPRGEGVVLRGTLVFNYPVDPEVLAPRIRLRDPAAAEPVAVELEARWQATEIPFRTAAVAKQKAARRLTLEIDSELTPAVGNVELGEAFGREIPLGSSEDLEVREVTGQAGLEESSLRIVLSSPVDRDVVRPYLAVEPAADYRLAADGNALTLRGDFSPGTLYAVRLAAGLPAADGAVLRADHETRLRLAHLPPSIDFASQGLFLSRRGLRRLAVETVNVERLRLAVDRVYANNLFFLLQQGGEFDQESSYYEGRLWRPLGDRVVEKTLRVDGERDRKTTTVLDLDDYLDAEAPGLYRVLVGRPDSWQAPQRWVMVTDIGAVARRAEGEFLLWALSHRTLAPLPGVAVELRSDQNQVIARGTTGSDGFWRAAIPGKGEARPFLVTLARGEDSSFLYLDRMRVDTTGLDVGGASRPPSGYSAFLYGERDLYRPGETVRGAALVRDERLRPAPAMPALLRYRDPSGREVERRTVEIDGRGVAAFDWEVPAYAATGRHAFELVVAEEVIGRWGVQIEEFVPDRIEVEIRPDAPAARVGETLGYEIASRFLFGPPAAGLAAETRVRLTDATFRPQGWAGYTFRDDGRTFSAFEVASREGRLDDDGRLAVTVDVPRRGRPPSTLEAVLIARVREAGGRGVTAVTRVDVLPYPYFLGLRRAGAGYPELGEEVELEWVAVAPDGSAAAAAELVAELVVERWQTVLRKTAAGTFRYQSTRETEVVASRDIPAGATSGSFTFIPSEYGSHRVVLRDPASDAATSVRFATGGWGYSPWAVENPDRLEIELDRDEYRPGDTLTAQIRAPFAGRLVLTVERDEVLARRTYSLAGNTATVSLPVGADWRPNAYLTATLVRAVGDIDPGGVGRAYGAVPIAVDRAANRLAVAIEAPPRTRSERRLEVAVATAPGAAVTLAAVDEGILQLIAQESPDPFAFFYRKLALGVTAFDTFGLLFPELEGLAPAGGGAPAEGRAQYVRTESIRRERPVSFWSGVLTAGADGRASASFELPTFAGALRLMAVAADGQRFGAAEERSLVRDPLILTPTLPRILSLGETLGVPVTLRNDTGRAGVFRLELVAEGAAEVAGEPALELEVAAGEERLAYFEVRTASREGAARFRFAASGNGERAASAAEVAVRGDLPRLVLARSGALVDRTTELGAPDPGFAAGSVSRRLQIGPLPLVRFGRQLGELLRYPYGCTEQILSRAFPLLYLEDLARQFEPELLDPERGGALPAQLVDEALRQLAYQQVRGGGFALWRGGRTPHPWTSVYAAHFLLEAERAGHPVDPQLLADALEHLAGAVRAKERYASAELDRVAYALWVLARAGEAELGVMDFVRERQLANLRPHARAMLAAAYAALGSGEAVDELLAGLAEAERVARQTGGNFRSTIRDRALVLLALLDARPESPRIPELVERLGRDASEGGQWTTQESAFALLALGQLAARQAERPPYSGTVWSGGERLGSFSSAATAVFAELAGDAPLEIRLADGYEPGSAFFTLTSRGRPTDEAFAPRSQGIEVERRLLDRAGAEIEPLALGQGDLVVVKVRVRSTSGAIANVVVEQLLPSGLEIENPRLDTTESLPWAEDANLDPAALDLRDDRILIFTALPENQWQTLYALARAVVPGTFRLPPIHAEAMYNPAFTATGPRGTLRVEAVQ